MKRTVSQLPVVGRDETGAPKYGAVRGTVSNFKRELDGRQAYVPYYTAKETNAVNLFKINYRPYYLASLEMMHRGWTKEDCLSLGGVYANKKTARRSPHKLTSTEIGLQRSSSSIWTTTR